LSARGKVLAPATFAAVGSVVSGPGTGFGSAGSTPGDDHPGSGGDLDVVVVGAVGIDTCVYLPGRDIDFSVEANFGENLDYVGQAGGFSSRGFAQLGYRTGFIGYVGNDYHADFISAELQRDGIELTLYRDAKGTRRSINLMAADGGRRNFFDGKGSMEVAPDLATCRSVLARARLAHFSIENWCRRLLQPARQLGAVVACDLQDVTTLEDPYRRDFIEAADILFFSAANLPDPGAVVATCLAARPSQIVVVGMGSRGCAVGAEGKVRFFPPAALALPVVDTNGAGDGLAVGFLTSYVLDGRDLPESVRRGQIVARYTCAQKSSTSNLISRPQLDLLAAGQPSPGPPKP
jgi:sugar/nucleoside kinase (ribokinase family)